MAEHGGRRILVLVRHGQSQTNALGIVSSSIEGYSLTKTGFEQAAKAAKSLSSLGGIDGFYSSPVLRARQTAEVIGEAIGMNAVVDERLRERWFGKIEGKSMPSSSNEIWKSDPRNEVMPWVELKAKVSSFIDSAVGSRIVAVSHGDTIEAACDLMDGRGAAVHQAHCPRNCNFVIIDLTNREIIAYDVEAVPEGI